MKPMLNNQGEEEKEGRRGGGKEEEEDRTQCASIVLAANLGGREVT